jgi:chromosome partitioning protein
LLAFWRARENEKQIACKHERTKGRKATVALFRAFLANQIDINHASQKAKMYVIVLASQKGGAGKTTLAAHLAVAAEAAGDGPAVLIDTDPQGSLSAWWNVRKAETPKLAPMTIAELPEKLELLGLAGYGVAVIDTPPAITEAIEAVVKSGDLVLIPTRPSPHDLRAVGSTVSLVQGANKPFVFAVTQAKPNTRLTVQALAALSEHGVVAPAIVHDRVDYAGSMIDGRTVQEIDAKGRSAAEMAELWEFLKAQMAKSTKAQSRAVA